MDERKERVARLIQTLKNNSTSVRTNTHRARAAMLGVALGVTASISAAPSVQTARPAPASRPVAKRAWYQIGRASWYGGSFNGRATASGETYNENHMTCAHRFLPLGSWIRVTNLHNQKSTLVRVTDRGPFVHNVVLDLSAAAARKLGFDSLAKVKIEKVTPEEVAAAKRQAAVPETKLAQLEIPAALPSGQ